MKSNIIAGIDMGTHSTRVVVAEYGPGMSMPRILGIGKSKTQGVRHGYIINTYDATNSIKRAILQAEKTSGIRVKEAYVSVGGIGLQSVITSGMATFAGYTTITDEHIDQTIDSAEQSLINRVHNRKIIHRIPLKFKIDGQSVLGSPLGLQGQKIETRILLITALEHHFEDLVSVMSEAGIDIIDVIAAPLAAGRSALGIQQKTAGCALVDIGAETVSMAVFEDNHPISLEVFSIGSTDITNDIALGFRIPLDEAEDIKLEQKIKKDFSKNRINEIIEARLSDIFELVDKHLEKIKRSGLLPAGIVITGGGSPLASMEEFAKATLNLPSRVMTISHLGNNSRKKLTDSSWFVAYGLCYYADEMNTHRMGVGRSLKHLKKRVGSLLKELLP